MRKKILVLVLIMSFMAALLGGCAGANKTPAGKFIRFNHGQEPESIDPALNTTVNGGTDILATFEGLTSLDKKDRPIAGTAESWDISPDNLTYTFHIRDNAKWSDGKPVTAKDFEYAWVRALHPKTGAEYAYQLFYIVNAQAFNEGKAKAEDIGIKVIDDKTLEVKLNAPTPYFLNLTAFPTLAPVREDIITKYGDKWALSAESYIGNGPFKLAEWKSKDYMKFVKNENYWDKDRVKIDGFIETFIAEASTMLSSYEAGELDIIDSVPLEEIENLKKTSKEFTVTPQLGTYYYCFNVKKAPFNDVRVRKAFALAVDREQFVTQVNKEGLPATAFVPPGVPDATPGSDFRKVGGDFFPVKAQPEEARKLLAEAGYPNGKGFPEVTLLYNTDEGHKKRAEAVLEMWKTNLGISNIKLSNQEWKVFIDSRQNGNYQIARHGWVGDYTYPMTFIDLFTTGNGNNDAQWSNPEFDKLIEKIRVAPDENERMELMHQAEKLFLDDVIMIPMFYYTQNSLINSNVKGVHKSPLGFTYFDKAWFAE
ncbi:MAG: peptide ABC transporter substrate-binding protein [Syntrophomonadaceae bacterium]|nr:peptide ABC transporter substrate-binding protein [Syntrophomonadaceae bacterium]